MFRFMCFNKPDGLRIKRIQYTVIDDATQVRSHKTYERHNQVHAIDFIDYVISKFSFRIKTVRTDIARISSIN